MKKAYEKNGKIVLKYAGKGQRETHEFIKSLPHVKWDSRLGSYVLPVLPALINRLERNGFTLDYTLRGLLLPDNEYNNIVIPREYHFMWEEDEFKWQETAFKFTQSLNDRALIVADPGAGKTPFTLKYLEYRNLFPALIICPNNVKYAWEEKAHKWLKNKRIAVLEGGDSFHTYKDVDIVIVNFDLLPSCVNKINGNKRTVYKILDPLIQFKDSGFKNVVIDETQFIKDEKTQFYRGVKYLTKDIGSIIGLSGTPIENYTKEFFNILNIIRPDVFPDRWEYLNHYCKSDEIYIKKRGKKKREYVQEFKGVEHADELNNILLKTVMLRVHRKSKVTRTVVPIPVDLNIYDASLKEFKSTVTESNAMAKFEWLKQVTHELKREQCLLRIDELIRKHGKVLIFAVNKAIISDIMDYYGEEAIKIDGDLNAKQKLNAVKEFQSEKIKVMAINNRAGAMGIDGLQHVCNTMVILQLPWHNSLLTQMEGRLDRGGQKLWVNNYIMTAVGTIDEEGLKLIDSKTEMVDSVVEGKDRLEKKELMTLLKEYKK